MKTAVLAIALAVISFMVPVASAQTTNPHVQDQDVVAKAKPFLGTWDAVVCDARLPKPYGVRFSIRVDAVKTEDGTTNTVLLKLLGVQTQDIKEAFDFETLGFMEVVADTPSRHWLWIDVTNGSLLLTLAPGTGSGPVHEEETATGLFGAVTDTQDVQSPVIALRDPGTDTNVFGYVDTLAKSCPTPQPQAKPAAATTDHLLRASR